MKTGFKNTKLKKNIVGRVSAFIFAAVLLMSSVPLTTVHAAGVVDSGNILGVDWALYDDGLLTLTGVHTSANSLTNFTHSSHPEFAELVTSVSCDYIPFGGESITSIFNGFTNLTSVTFGSTFTGNSSNIINTAYAFNGCTSLTSLNANGLDMRNVEYASLMFNECKLLTTLDVSNWNVGKLLNTTNMFAGCTSLTTLDVSNWNVNSVEYTSYMFENCTSLATLDVGLWDVSSLSSASGMFFGCASLTTLDVSNWDLSNASSIGSMFEECKLLTTLDVSNWNVSSASSIRNMFAGCTSLASIDVSNWNVSNVLDMASMFSNCTLLTSINVSNWNVSNALDISYMFFGCTSLTNLDVLLWDVSNVSNMSYMFVNCTSFTILDLSTWNVISVGANILFGDCGNLSTFKTPINNTDTYTIPASDAFYRLDEGTGVVDASVGYYWISADLATSLTLVRLTPGAPVIENEVAATCTIGGSYDEVVYDVDFGEEISRNAHTTPALGHVHGAPVIENEVAPQDGVDGSYDVVVYCDICNEELSRTANVVPELGHTPGTPVIENRVEPQIGVEGNYDAVVYCDICNEELSRTNIIIPALPPVYIVTFVDWNDVELYTNNVVQGNTSASPSAPTRAADSGYTYQFVGWDKDFSNITDTLTVKALYTGTAIPVAPAAPAPVQIVEPEPIYTVTFVDWNGTALLTSNVKSGDSVAAPDAPTRDADISYTYIFSGWDKDFSNVTDNLTVTAVYGEIAIPEIIVAVTEEPKEELIVIEEVIEEIVEEPTVKIIEEPAVEQLVVNSEPIITPEPKTAEIKNRSIEIATTVTAIISITGGGFGSLFFFIWWRRRKVSGSIIGENVCGLLITLVGKDSLETYTNELGDFVFKNVKEDNLVLTVYNIDGDAVFSAEIYTKGKTEEEIFTVIESNVLTYEFTKHGKVFDIKIEM